MKEERRKSLAAYSKQNKINVLEQEFKISKMNICKAIWQGLITWKRNKAVIKKIGGMRGRSCSTAVVCKVIPRPTVSPSPGNLLEIHILVSIRDLLKQKLWEWAQVSVF